jgi:cell division septation protein DedD
VLYECTHCGAPLDVRAPGSVVQCNYCSRSQRIASGQTGMMPTPASWRPPPFWTPPPQYYAYVPPQPLVYHAPAKAAGCAVGLVLIPVLLFTGGLAAYLLAGKTSPFEQSWDGKTTLTCNGQMKISGVRMPSKLPKAVLATEVCQLEISDSELIADTVIEAGGAAKVTIKNSTLIATDTAVVADLGSRVDLQGVTIRVGEGRPSLDGTTGLRADAGAVIDAHDLTMSFGGSGPVGTAVAVDARVAGKVSLTNATIRGPYKVRVDMLGQIDVTSSKLRAEVEGDASHVRGIEVVSPPAPPSTAASSPSTAPPPPAKQPRSAPAPKPSPTPKPAPAPTVKKINPCGCKSGDLNCSLRCNQR